MYNKEMSSGLDCFFLKKRKKECVWSVSAIGGGGLHRRAPTRLISRDLPVSPRRLSAMTTDSGSLLTEMEAFTFAVTTQVDLPIRIKM